MEVFDFTLSPVTDVHSVLYITVFDNEKCKDEFLGRVAIPLMKVSHFYN